MFFLRVSLQNGDQPRNIAATDAALVRIGQTDQIARGAEMSVRKRKWTTAKGELREAWIVDYVDQQGDRHIETFTRKKEADDYHKQVGHEVSQGVHTAPNKSITVAQAADDWICYIEGERRDASARCLLEDSLHFYASWCINRRKDGGLELPPKTVQSRLGHASIVMTLLRASIPEPR
jgi:hypothetical protein